MTYKTGLSTQIAFAIPATWSAEQALAVVELLDDLRERIWQHYELAFHDIVRQEYGNTAEHDGPVDDPPF